MKKVTKAVIPAAGLGTRVLPATKAMPKGMLPIVDKPAIQYLVEEAVKSGITDILIILGRSQSIIEDQAAEKVEPVPHAPEEKRCDLCVIGAGGGGFLLFYVEPDKQEAVHRAMEELLYVPFEFENSGTRVIHYTPETYEKR